MPFVEETLSKETVLDCPIFRLVKHRVSTVSGKISSRYIIEHRGAVAIAALTPEGKLLMIRQFRKSLEKVLWEIPAGMIDPDEQPQEFPSESGIKCFYLGTAKRELKEETGWEAENWRPLFNFHGSVGYTNEKLEIWRCDCTVKGNTDFDDSEDIDLYEMEIPELVNMIRSGEITDGKTVAAILMLAQEEGR